jgi:hypothetical protein
VRSENLFFLALVALPLVVAVCLGLSVRTLVGRGSRWWLWLWAAVVLSVFWYVYLLGVR